MPWNPTNADDVKLVVSTVSRDDSGARTGSTSILSSEVIVVDDFSIDTEEDMEALSGIGNAEALGVSKGDIEHSFSFTVQGEDANLFNSLASNDDGRANELEILLEAEDYKDKLTGAYAGTRNISGSSGDPIEYEAEGIATGRTPGELSESE
jgi:hypothetical protein